MPHPFNNYLQKRNKKPHVIPRSAKHDVGIRILAVFYTAPLSAAKRTDCHSQFENWLRNDGEIR